MMDLEWTQSCRQWEARAFCDTRAGLKKMMVNGVKGWVEGRMKSGGS